MARAGAERCSQKTDGQGGGEGVILVRVLVVFSMNQGRAQGGGRKEGDWNILPAETADRRTDVQTNGRIMARLLLSIRIRLDCNG